MLTKKSIGIALAAALALGVTGVASATTINVDGVQWNTNNPLDFSANALNLLETSVSAKGDTLTGYGQVGSINGNTSFCSGCDLTFTFQYTVSALGTSGGTNPNPQVVFDGGTIQFYVSPAGTFNIFNPSTANSGTPWLTLTGHMGSRTGFSEGDGTLFSNVTGSSVANPANGSNGVGYLDVTGGPAGMYLNSNSVPDGIGGFADFLITSTFFTAGSQPTSCGAATTNLDFLCGLNYSIQGTATLNGKSVTSVPEPGEIGLLGLGLGFLGFLIRRRRKDADRKA